MTTPDHALYPNYTVPPSPHQGVTVAWGFRHPATDAETLAVELVTRAVETTGNPNPHPSFTELSKNRPPNIGIRITKRDHGLLIEVWDSDPTLLQGADAHLTIVANVSQDWGCYRPRGGGKVIWAELGVPRQRRVRHTCGDYACFL